MTKGEILSYDEYARIEAEGFVTPYVVEVKHDNQCLLFYGSEHTHEPSHPQFNDIEKRWSLFIADYVNPIALVEGNCDACSVEETQDRDRSIAGGGEAQLVVYLARRDGVTVSSPEPDKVWEANELAKEFGRDHTAFYYFIRQIAYWNRLTEKRDLEEEAKTMLGFMEASSGWEDVQFTPMRMAAIHLELFNKPLSFNDTQWLHDITGPTPQGCATNAIAIRCGELRDEHILKEIQTYWRNDRSPFVVFGSAHAIRLEPALRKL